MCSARMMAAAVGGVLLTHGLAPRALADDSRWGLQQDTPVQVCRADGQRAWLRQLRCTDGSDLSWRRSGNVGPRVDLPPDFPIAALEKYMSGAPLAEGEVDYHVIDAYQVDCGGKAQALYLDMYHCELPPPQRAPAGFEFVAGTSTP